MQNCSNSEPVETTIDVQAPLLTPQPEQQEADARTSENSKRCTWIQTTEALLSLQLGWGLWLFPACFAALGWIPSLVVTLGLAVSTIYSGTLFSRLYQSVPQAVIFGDIGYQAVGPKGRSIVYFIVYILDATRCIVMHLAATKSLRHVLGRALTPPLWQCGLSVLLVAGLASQVRNLSRLSWFFITGSTAQLFAIGIVVYCLLMRSDHAARTQLVGSTGQLDRQLVAFFNVVFAYGGQFAFTEFMADMRQPRDFTRAMSVCTSIMTSLYLGLGAAGYWAKGDEVADVVIFSLKDGPLAQTAAAFVLLQALAQYLVNINIWSHNLLILIGRATGSTRSATARSASEHCPRRWLITSLLVVSYSCLLSIFLPYFSSLVGVIASLTYLVCAYTLPCWLALKLFGGKMWRFERWLCWGLIPISLLVSAAGLFGSVRSLIADVQQHGSGFTMENAMQVASMGYMPMK